MKKQKKLRPVHINCTGWVFEQPGGVFKATITGLDKDQRGKILGYFCTLRHADDTICGEGIAFPRDGFYHAPDELPRLVEDIHDAISLLIVDLKIMSAVLGSEMEKSEHDDHQHDDDAPAKTTIN